MIILAETLLRYFSLLFILYEVSLDVLFSGSINIFKNALYIIVMIYPAYYRLFSIAIFYGIFSHMTYFKSVTNHTSTLLLDFALISFLNYVIYLSYINCDKEKAIPSIIPILIMYFFSSPLLKGMMLRYSEILESEEEEGNIMSSLNA